MYTVYILRWARTHLTYVGMTKDPVKRLREHLKKGSELYPVIQEYGVPYLEPLATNLTKELAVRLEAHYIETLNSHNGTNGEGFNTVRMFDSLSGVRK